ncbi:hypothetical protein N9Y89_02520 [bacterium]|nr:hypothetical protein [bacterium]
MILVSQFNSVFKPVIQREVYIFRKRVRGSQGITPLIKRLDVPSTIDLNTNPPKILFENALE